MSSTKRARQDESVLTNKASKDFHAKLSAVDGNELYDRLVDATKTLNGIMNDIVPKIFAAGASEEKTPSKTQEKPHKNSVSEDSDTDGEDSDSPPVSSSDSDTDTDTDKDHKPNEKDEKQPTSSNGGEPNREIVMVPRRNPNDDLLGVVPYDCPESLKFILRYLALCMEDDWAFVRYTLGKHIDSNAAIFTEALHRKLCTDGRLRQPNGKYRMKQSVIENFVKKFAKKLNTVSGEVLDRLLSDGYDSD